MSAPLPPPVVPGTPPQPPYQPAFAPPPPYQLPPPKSGLSTASIAVLTFFVGFLALGAIAAIWLGSRAPTPGGDGSAASDVKMDSCEITSYDSPKAHLSVHNSTKSERDYVITVVFERSGTQIGSGVATVVDLWPGQTATTEAVGFGTDTTGSVRCRVSSVRRI